MGTLARFVIYCSVLFETLFLFTFKLNFLRVGIILLVLGLLLSKAKRLRPTTKSLMIWAYALVFFRFTVDIGIQNDGSLNAVTQLIKELAIISILPLFEMVGDRRIRIVRTFVIAMIPAALFGLAQIFSPSFTISGILPQNPIILTYDFTQSYLIAEKRIVGTFGVAIGFALYLGVFAIVIWAAAFSRKGYQQKIWAAAALLACFGLILFTQTRSAIYGVIPAVLLAVLVEDFTNIRRHLKLIVVGMVCVVSFGSFQIFVSSVSERSSLEELDSSTFIKIAANVYGTYAALSRNPLIGVTNYSDDYESVTQYMELIDEGRSELGSIIDTEFEDKIGATNHNLYAYYLRYYGVLGFGLLMVVIYKLYLKAKEKHDVASRYLCLGVLIYVLQYALLHNTMLMETAIIWIVMAVGEEKGFTKRRSAISASIEKQRATHSQAVEVNL